MRRYMALMLALVMCLSAPFARGEDAGEGRGGRGKIEIVEEPVEQEEFSEEEMSAYSGDDDWVVYDPTEEYLYDEELITQAFETLDGYRNILLLGVDSRTSSMEGRTDTMVLLSVDIERNKIKLTSFLRDMYVEIPGNKNNRLNAAYVFGGFNLLAKTLKTNFGVMPDAYVAVNLNGLSQIIDSLGGVEVEVKANKVDRVNAVIYWYNKQVLNLNNLKDGYLTRGGLQHLNGKQAEAWARYRYSETDFQRSERQRQLLTLLYEKITQMTTGELVGFAIANMPLVETNLTFNEIIALAPAVLALKGAEIQQMQLPLSNAYESKTISGMAVLVPDRQKSINALAKFLNE